jgi:hypothetical protein
MRGRNLLFAFFIALGANAQGQNETRFVVLPASAATSVDSQGTWQPTKADIDGAEASVT